MNKNPEPTVEELVALLSKTSLPTVVVEGREDIIVYRRFEDGLDHKSVSFIGAGGRGNVIEIFKNRHLIKSAEKIVFVADRDVWVNSGIPDEYQSDDLIFTDGYSLENDVYRDGCLERFLVKTETGVFRGELDRFLDWYALALSRKMEGGEEKICLHPTHVLTAATYASLTALKPGENFPAKLRSEVGGAYQRLTRGKSLLALLVRTLSRSGREPKHNSKALMELVALNPREHLTALREKIAARF